MFGWSYYASVVMVSHHLLDACMNQLNRVIGYAMIVDHSKH